MRRNTGCILSVDCEHGYGFIARPDRGLNVHFDKRNLVTLDFDPSIIGREVSFRAVIQPGCRCLTAHDIRARTPGPVSTGKAYGFKLRRGK
jgi:hypothetical protein